MSRAAPSLGEAPAAADVAADLDAALVAEVPLTVAAVAARLGVAPSTLRTWDRRYGLGPSGRSAGSHRRYTPEDVARLETMRRLTLAGAAPSDAARLAAPGRRPSAGALGPAAPVLVDALTLAAAAVDGAETRLRGLLAAATRSQGAVETWDDVVLPAFRFLSAREGGDRAGRDPEALLASAVLAGVRETTEASEPQHPTAGTPRVVLLADAARPVDRVGAHVLAGALAVRGPVARVLTAPVSQAAFLRLVESAPAVAVCVVGPVPGAAEVARAASEHGVEVVLVGADSPDVGLPGVVRVRTLSGALHEVAGLVAGATEGTGGASRPPDAPT